MKGLIFGMRTKLALHSNRSIRRNGQACEQRARQESKFVKTRVGFSSTRVDRGKHTSWQGGGTVEILRHSIRRPSVR